MAKPGAAQIIQIGQSIADKQPAKTGVKGGPSRFDNIMSQMKKGQPPAEARQVGASSQVTQTRQLASVKATEQTVKSRALSLGSPMPQIRTIAAHDISSKSQPVFDRQLAEEGKSTGMSGHFYELIRGLNEDQLKIDQIMEFSLTNANLSTNELLALQAGAYRFTQEMEIASRMMEQALKGVNQTMNTQLG